MATLMTALIPPASAGPACPPPFKAYVMIGNGELDKNDFARDIIENSAAEAFSDFQDAGYDVILDNAATANTVNAAIMDSCTRAIWIAGHGSRITPAITMNGGTTLTADQSTSGGTTVFVKSNPNLNQVVLQSCYQDKPEWRSAFPGASFESYTTYTTPYAVFWNEFFGGYPEIDPVLGGEIKDGICVIQCQGDEDLAINQCEQTESQEIAQCQQTESETIGQCETDGFNEFLACSSEPICEQQAIDDESACIDQALLDGSSCVSDAEQNGSMCVGQGMQAGLECVQACPAMFPRNPMPNIHPSLARPDIQINGNLSCDFNNPQPRDSCTVLDPAFGSQTFNFFAATDDFVSEILLFSGSVEDGSLVQNSLSVDPLNPADFDLVITNSALFDILENPNLFFSFVTQGKVLANVNNPQLSEQTALSGFNDLFFCQGFPLVAGSLTPIDSTMVLVAGAQSISAWMIPVIVAGIGIAIVIARKF